MTFNIITFSITTFSIITFSITTFSITTFSIRTFSIMTLSIKGLFVSLILYNTLYKGIICDASMHNPEVEGLSLMKKSKSFM
jgi:hypothetical protein